MPVENPNAFKLLISRDVVKLIGTEIAFVFPEFDQTAFLKVASTLHPLELKGRVVAVREQLRKVLPQDFLTALQTLVSSTKRGRLKGFALWPYTEFIQTYGLDTPRESLSALKRLTELFTAEFGVRPFLVHQTDETLKFLLKCAKSSNEHIRRWASEGSRPRLPWGERLDVFIRDPSKTLPILELLKNDDSLYVRKSVANHLNDISKDHPDLTVRTLKRWQRESLPQHRERIEWITHRALRTLIKKGDSGALAAIGVSSKPKLKITKFAIDKLNYRIGDRLTMSFEIQSQAPTKQSVVVDYVIHFMKANGQTRAKVFKLKKFSLDPHANLRIDKQHHLKKITTRQYYSGQHRIEIQVNGLLKERADWTLKV